MPSCLIPNSIKIAQAPGYIKLEGPFGCCIKKTGEASFSIVYTPEGMRLFSNDNATGLSLLFQLARGLAYGSRRRLRLTGIGFRGYMRKSNEVNSSSKGYIRKRLLTVPSADILILKIGFSHEIPYCSAQTTPVAISASRLEGRTKGTLLYLKSSVQSNVSQAAAEIQAFRTPDVYKGKGIYYDKQKIKLKKGKRQG
jgi:large subunit ribosomal protein L6